MSEKINLIVYTNTGNTYFFKCVKNFIKIATGFEFDYEGVASGQISHAVFNNVSTAGFAKQIIQEKR